MIKSQHVRLFLISFLILFLELAVIRYIPSQVRYVGFFSNIILLGAFVGIGWGTLFKDYVKIPDFFLPIFIFIFELLIGVFQYDLIITSNEVVYFSALNFRLQGEPVFLLPVIFFIVVILFSLPSKILGNCFKNIPPLTAYTINIIGSIDGIVVFSIISFLGGGPFVWFPL